MSDSQAVLLGYFGQQAIAHAALVFATLAAAFTFATGFLSKTTTTLGLVLYGLSLFALFFVAAYSMARFLYYGNLAGQMLYTEIVSETLTGYWKRTEQLAYAQHDWLRYLGNANWASIGFSVISALIAAVVVVCLAKGG